jgi:hypothetical protein
LENNQTAEGIHIPQVLQTYTGFEMISWQGLSQAGIKVSQDSLLKAISGKDYSYRWYHYEEVPAHNVVSFLRFLIPNGSGKL